MIAEGGELGLEVGAVRGDLAAVIFRVTGKVEEEAEEFDSGIDADEEARGGELSSDGSGGGGGGGRGGRDG
jgi:hypothetical protein